jgi:hypothetical protein
MLQHDRIRIRIKNLLDQSRDAKILQGGLTKAIQLAREAFQLASQAPGSLDFSHPWRELAAYRLAHLLMRQPHVSFPQLEEVNDLLNLAGGDNSLSRPAIGPLPLIYRLAVLKRIQSQLSGMDQDRYDQLNSEILKIYQRCSRPNFWESQIQEYGETQLHATEFNMLEVAAWACDLPLDSLQGLGVKLPGLLDQRGWFLGSNLSEWSKIYMTEDFARAELQQLAVQYPESLIVAPDSNNGNHQIGCGLQARQFLNRDSYLILQHCLTTANPTLESLREFFRKQRIEVPSDEAFRQKKTRLSDQIQSLFGNRKLEVFRMRLWVLALPKPVFLLARFS